MKPDDLLLLVNRTMPYGKYKGRFAEPVLLQYSAEALELAAIYDRISARDRKLLRALAIASESPPELPEEAMPPDDPPGAAPSPQPSHAR